MLLNTQHQQHYSNSIKIWKTAHTMEQSLSNISASSKIPNQTI